MNEITVVYPHQLFKESTALNKKRPVFLVEETLTLTHNPIHRQKLVFHKLSLDSYEKFLIKSGYEVTRLCVSDYPTTQSVFEHLRSLGVKKMHIADTTDNYLEKAIGESEVERVWHDSSLFVLTKEEAVHRYLDSKRFMANFYKQLRKDRMVLVDEDGKPVGGKWSFDEENRQKIPKGLDVPEEIEFLNNQDIKEAEQWAEKVDAEKYGEAGCWLPYTHADAEKFLKEFLRVRFHNFGPYEDAMTTRGVRLWHSTLSPLINVGLLTPVQVLNEAIEFAADNKVPTNSLEGFIRQILGWREFIRAAYESDGAEMRTKNFWQHTKKLPDGFWSGKTGVEPVDLSIKRALECGYTHHIERLMVLGNFMLLNLIDPDEVYRWFMGMYLDAYDWVMVPNVYGMSQFADGGLFATKPYISGSNYVKKMSDYKGGDWEETWTALYWNFIDSNREFFKSNYRLSMMVNLLDRMEEAKKQSLLKAAKDYLKV